MAINKQALDLLFELKREGLFNGSLCQLGKQTILVSSEKVQKCARNFGYEINSSTEALPWTGNASDDYVFKGLGYTEVLSFDVDDFEGATHVVDLNIPIPDSFEAKYDGVYDGGTSEHVFHIPNLLKNIDKILKPGGIVMHALPCNNFVDHGFYMFSPTFLYDYYEANGYQIIRSNILEITNGLFGERWSIYDYKPLSIEHLSVGGWGSSMLGIWVVAKKNINKTKIEIPSQSRYKKVWNFAKSKKESEDNLSINTSRLIQWLKKNRYLYLVLSGIRECYTHIRLKISPKSKPKRIARY